MASNMTMAIIATIIAIIVVYAAYALTTHNGSGLSRPGPATARPSYNVSGFNQSGYNQSGYNKTGYNQSSPKPVT